MRLVPVISHGAKPRRASDGFSLVELLVVIAIVATLGAIALGLMQGARLYAATLQARGDMAALSQALELYRRHYGDYPQQADTPEKFYAALAGNLGPDGASIHGGSMITELSVGRKFPDDGEAANSFVDPWGNAYQYVFFTREDGNSPAQRGYVLYSFGSRSPNENLPTRTDVVPTASGAQGGVISPAPGNAKNIYTGQ